MAKFIASTFWSGLSVGVRAVGSLAINKLVAVLYGPDGIGLLAHFQNLLAIVSTVPNGGINIGLLRYLSVAKSTQNRYRAYFWAGLWLNILTFSAGVFLLLLSHSYYFEFFSKAAHGSLSIGWYLAFVSGALLLIFNLFLLNVLLAAKKMPFYAFITTGVSLVSLAALWLGMRTQPFTGALLYFLWGQAIWCGAGALLAYKFRLLPLFLVFYKIPKRFYQHLSKFIIMALSTVLFMKLVDFFVRDYVIQRFSLYQTGLWQSVVKISDNYTLFYTSLMGLVYYAHLASLLPNRADLQAFVQKALLVVLPLLALALFVFYIFSSFFVTLLFSPVFSKALYLLDYQLIGDFFKLGAYLLASIISVQANVRLYIATQFASALIYITFLFLLIEPMGLEGITLAHALRYGLFFGFYVLYFRKLLWQKV